MRKLRPHSRVAAAERCTESGYIQAMATHFDAVHKEDRHICTIGIDPRRVGIDIAHDQFRTTTAERFDRREQFFTQMTAATAVNNDFAHRRLVSGKVRACLRRPA